MIKTINPAIMQYHEENRFFNIFVGPGLEGKRQHVENVIKFTEILHKHGSVNINEELLCLCTEHHDDGRVNQMELIGKFWDTKVSHNVLGLERFDKAISRYGCSDVDDSIRIFRDCLLYHGRQQLVSNGVSKPYVELITAADNFENACSAVSYLLHEVETDAKGYRHDHPDLDQSTVSNFVFEHFANGELFDKMKFCSTYAEYVLFAATLATNCIKRYGSMAKEIMLKPSYGYSSILEGYKVIFEKVLTKTDSERAYDILYKML